MEGQNLIFPREVLLDLVVEGLPTDVARVVEWLGRKVVVERKCQLEVSVGKFKRVLRLISEELLGGHLVYRGAAGLHNLDCSVRCIYRHR